MWERGEGRGKEEKGEGRGERGGEGGGEAGGSVLRLGHLVIRPTVEIGLACVPLLARRPTARFPSSPFPRPLPLASISLLG